MDKDKITLQEETNDGQSVFLYYDAMAGVYLAYGLSAYYTTMVTDPYMSYSELMHMPVALLRRNHIKDLRQSLVKLEHTQKQYYHFQTIGDGQPRGPFNKHAAQALLAKQYAV